MPFETWNTDRQIAWIADQRSAWITDRRISTTSFYDVNGLFLSIYFNTEMILNLSKYIIYRWHLVSLNSKPEGSPYLNRTKIEKHSGFKYRFGDILIFNKMFNIYLNVRIHKNKPNPEHLLEFTYTRYLKIDRPFPNHKSVKNPVRTMKFRVHILQY